MAHTEYEGAGITVHWDSDRCIHRAAALAQDFRSCLHSERIGRDDRPELLIVDQETARASV